MMNPESLKVSIVTVNYNDAAGLEKTISSVLHQTYKNIEYLIIDGGSADGSKDVITANQDRINYWVSERDGGIFNAMNKGINASTGDYLLFINSGDVLVDDNVIQEIVSEGLSEDLVYGNVVFTNGTRREDWVPDSELTFNTFYKQSIPHQSTFIKRSLFDKIGRYSENYKMVSDWEFFMVAVCKYQCSYRHVNRFVAAFNEDGISSDPSNYPAMAKERAGVFEKHFPFFIKDYEMFSAMQREFQKIAYFNKARHFVKRILKAVKLGPS